MSTIIGFGHRSRSGKDTAAATIIKQFGIPQPQGKFSTQKMSVGSIEGNDMGRGTGTVSGIDVRRYAFADAVKREVNEAAIPFESMVEFIFWGKREGRLPEWVVYDPEAPMDDPLCPLGKQRSLLQFWGTNYRRAQDEDYWVNQVAQKIASDNPTFALLTDFRFENEASILDFKVKVDRPGIKVLDHPSEHALDKYEGWDIVISNDSDLDTFQRRVLSTFEFIRGYTQGQHSYNEKFKDLTLFGC